MIHNGLLGDLNIHTKDHAGPDNSSGPLGVQRLLHHYRRRARLRDLDVR
jgi:hypothetical protein